MPRSARFALRGLAAAASLVSAAALAPAPAEAALPVAMLAKQMLQQVVKDQLRSVLEGTLRGALQRATAGGCGTAGGMLAGMSGLPAMGAMAGPSAAEVARMLDAAPMPAEQRAEVMAALAEWRRMQAEARPASPAELRAVLADAQALGLIEADAIDELPDCIDGPAAAPVLGMVVSGLREAVDEARRTRDRLASTPPEQRDAVIAEMAAELRAMDAEERDEALAAMTRPSGVFPDWLREGLRASVR